MQQPTRRSRCMWRYRRDGAGGGGGGEQLSRDADEEDDDELLRIGMLLRQCRHVTREEGLGGTAKCRGVPLTLSDPFDPPLVSDCR